MAAFPRIGGLRSLYEDQRIYRSDLVWKACREAQGIDLRIELGAGRKPRGIDLSGPRVKAKMRERYGIRGNKP